MLSKKMRSALPIVVGGVLVCAVLAYVVLWSIGKNKETSASLDRLDQAVDTSDWVTKAALKVLSDQQLEQKERLDKLERFLFLPTDERGRRIVTVPDLQYLLQMKQMEGWSWAEQWTTEQWSRASASREWVSSVLTKKDFQLPIPYSSTWGNAEYAVAPYELDGEDVLFGKIIIFETSGAYREARFSVAPKQSLEEVVADPKNRSFACSTDMQELRPTIVTIGSRQVARVIWETCESGRTTYIISGKDRNYVFETMGDEALIEWVVERFKET